MGDNKLLPFPASDIIQQLHLRKHPEGGYFVETDRQKQEILSPYSNGALRSLATSIFYFLMYDEPGGVFHMNKSVTQHLLHHGRVEYTLIVPGRPPKIEKIVLGTNTAAGERRQLVVGTGIWKRSNLLQEDITSARTPEAQAHVGCLITEVMIPGFDWQDHVYMSEEHLRDMFHGVEGGQERIMEFQQFVSKCA